MGIRNSRDNDPSEGGHVVVGVAARPDRGQEDEVWVVGGGGYGEEEEEKEEVVGFVAGGSI